MSKHTPGPWDVQKAEDCMGRKLDDLVKWVVTGNQHDLWITTGPTWDPEHAEESEANARLIASAPDSHEANMQFVIAVEEMLRITSECSDDRIYDDMPSSSLASAYFSARAAIAKATGE